MFYKLSQELHDSTSTQCMKISCFKDLQKMISSISRINFSFCQCRQTAYLPSNGIQ
eukprot:c37768_g1_i1 orf=45-212(+)